MMLQREKPWNSKAKLGKRPALRVSVLLFTLATLCGCGNKQTLEAASSGSAPRSARPPAPVVVSTVEQRSVPVQITAIGNVEAYQMVQIRSQVNGQIESIHFREGRMFTKASYCSV